MNHENENKIIKVAASFLTAAIYVCISLLLLAFTAKIILWLLY